MTTGMKYGVIGAVLGIGGGLILSTVLLPQIGWRGAMAEKGDQYFIEAMIPHHEGAIAMAQLAQERSTRPEIQSLAAGIIEAQTREIEDMQSWYAAWFGAVPSGAGHQGHGAGMQGMEGDLEALAAATDFDQEFLAQMIVHHEMAVMMAEMLAQNTERAEMKILADQIITSQTREIAMMKSWQQAFAQ